MQKDMILTTDACTSGIAYILSQLDDQGREHVISYGGRGLRKSEINWSISKLECLAIIYGTRAYHQYLVSRPFTIVTDHVSLTFLNSLNAGKSRLQRWALHLQGYTFTVQHKANKRLTSADGLSRREFPTPPENTNNDALDDDAFVSCIEPRLFDCTVNVKYDLQPNKSLHTINFVYASPNDINSTHNAGKTFITSVAAISDDVDISNAQRQCPDFHDIIAYLETGTLPGNAVAARRIVLDSEQYTVLDNTLYHLHIPRQKHKDQVSSVVRQLCLPRSLRNDVTTAYHDNNGHIGFDKLYESIRVKYFWPRMYADLCEYVRSCIECQQTERPIHSKKAPLKSLSVEDVFSRFHLDYLGPLPLSNGFRYILVAIDSTSLYPEIHPTKTCDADETANVLYEQSFADMVAP